MSCCSSIDVAALRVGARIKTGSFTFGSSAVTSVVEMTLLYPTSDAVRALPNCWIAHSI